MLIYSEKILGKCLRRHDTQHKDIQHNDTQHNDTQHNGTQHNETQHNDTTFRITLKKCLSQHDDI